MTGELFRELVDDAAGDCADARVPRGIVVPPRSEPAQAFGGLRRDDAPVRHADNENAHDHRVGHLRTEVGAADPGGERDAFAGWAADGRALFVYHGQKVPRPVDRLDVATGARSAWKTVHPIHAAVSGLRTLIVSPDGAMAYGYGRTRTELYVIMGLK